MHFVVIILYVTKLKLLYILNELNIFYEVVTDLSHSNKTKHILLDSNISTTILGGSFSYII